MTSADHPWNIDEVAHGLRTARLGWRAAHRHNVELGVAGFPSRARIEAIVDELSAALFPQRLGTLDGVEDEDDYVAAMLDHALSELLEQVALELNYWSDGQDQGFRREDAETVLRHFAAALPEIRKLIDSDIEAAYLADPAARSIDEVLICYPSAIAVIHYRLANQLHNLGAPLVARIISSIANARTGIDIHPGATIGPGLFIDHGNGVVIGETAIVGARVRLYQAVTLGARRLPAQEAGSVRKRYARHPIVEDDVTIYAGATILGRVTIGEGSSIGGNVWLTESVPPQSIVTQAEPRHRVTRRLVPSIVEAFAE